MPPSEKDFDKALKDLKTKKTEIVSFADLVLTTWTGHHRMWMNLTFMDHQNKIENFQFMDSVLYAQSLFNLGFWRKW
jgi:hypothetical protein